MVARALPVQHETNDVYGVRAKVQKRQQRRLRHPDLHAEVEVGLGGGGEPVPVRDDGLEHDRQEEGSQQVGPGDEDKVPLVGGDEVAAPRTQVLAVDHLKDVRPALERVGGDRAHRDDHFHRPHVARAVVDEGGAPVEQLPLHPEQQEGGGF